MRFIDMVAVAQDSAQKRRDSKEKIAGMQFIDNQELKNSGALNLQELRNEGGANIQNLRNDGASDVQELSNEGRFDVQGLANEGAIDVQGLRNTGASDVATIRQEGANFRHGALSANQASQSETALALGQTPDWKIIYDAEDNPTGAYDSRGAVNPMQSSGSVESFINGNPNRRQVSGPGTVQETRLNPAQVGAGAIDNVKKKALESQQAPVVPVPSKPVTQNHQPRVLPSSIPMTEEMAALRDEPQPIVEAFRRVEISPEELATRRKRRQKRMGGLGAMRSPYTTH